MHILGNQVDKLGIKGSVAYLHVVEYKFIQGDNKVNPLSHANRKFVFWPTLFLLCHCYYCCWHYYNVTSALSSGVPTLCVKWDFWSLIFFGDSQSVPTELISDLLLYFLALWSIRFPFNSLYTNFAHTMSIYVTFWFVNTLLNLNHEKQSVQLEFQFQIYRHIVTTFGTQILSMKTKVPS